MDSKLDSLSLHTQCQRYNRRCGLQRELALAASPTRAEGRQVAASLCNTMVPSRHKQLVTDTLLIAAAVAFIMSFSTVHSNIS